MNNFQKSGLIIHPDPPKQQPDMIANENSPRCPEKPARRSREKSIERSHNAEPNSSVMSIVSRLNALSM